MTREELSRVLSSVIGGMGKKIVTGWEETLIHLSWGEAMANSDGFLFFVERTSWLMISLSKRRRWGEIIT